MFRFASPWMLLLLPLVLGSGGTFTTVAPSLHTHTNARVLQAFTGREIELEELDGHRHRVTVPA